MSAAHATGLTLTLRQEQVLRFMVTHLDMEQQLPTCREIAEAFGWVGTNAAADMLLRLERAGALARNSRRHLVLTWAGAVVGASQSPLTEAAA